MTLGTSLNDIGHTTTVLTPMPSHAHEALRELYERLWTEATLVGRRPPPRTNTKTRAMKAEMTDKSLRTRCFSQRPLVRSCRYACAADECRGAGQVQGVVDAVLDLGLCEDVEALGVEVDGEACAAVRSDVGGWLRCVGCS